MCLDKSEKVFVAKTYVSEGAEKAVGDKAGEVGWITLFTTLTITPSSLALSWRF